MSEKLRPNRAREHTRQQPVAETMAAAIGVLDLGSACTDHHVELLVHQHRDQRGGGGGVVGRVAIGKDVDVRLDIREHAADDAALALHPLAPDHRARRLRPVDRAIGTVVVVDVDDRLGQRGAERRHRLRDRRLLVEAG